MKHIIALFVTVIIILGLPLFFNMSNSFNMIENYSNLGVTTGDYPCSETELLVQDTFPITGTNRVSEKSNAWWRYPIFKVGSYAQITNNIRYPNNPDTGRCMPEDFCDAMYKNRVNKSNYTKQFPPVDPNNGTRIGYFNTNQNLLPFKTDGPNILY